MESEEHSSIQLASNIMLKSKFLKDKYSYVPVDLLPDNPFDVRVQSDLSIMQRKQIEKKMYYTHKIKDEAEHPERAV